MDEKPNKKDYGQCSGKELKEHSPGKWFSTWEDQCIREAESDTTADSLYAREHQDLEQKLWLSFQNTASAIAQLYKDRAQSREEMWVSFQSAAEFATNMYRDSTDGCKSMSDLSSQCGYHRRNKELLIWAKKKRRHIRREDLIGYLCGRSPPLRAIRPSSSLSRNQESLKDSRLQTFRDAVSENGLNGAMAGISFGSESPRNSNSSQTRNCQQNFHPDLNTFLSEEFQRRAELLNTRGRSNSPSRKRPSGQDSKPSSPKRRK